MNEAAGYAKIVEWSDEDNCFVGNCPGLFDAGCHGDDEQKVYADLCERVTEIIELYAAENRPLPPVTSGRDFANRMQQV